ncbi:flagellar hook-basal body complex protein FliE [uncultured Campylobacter sp.]|uniref:flagellar hook-basal body complex protein FliE n=1 Tax=uncultured Campylobacter sp. TaxID=218934 RepID=UPI002618CC55|nr:flagellar hook-basal body complex protein FliE [uncultured Campylobacter sp.]
MNEINKINGINTNNTTAKNQNTQNIGDEFANLLKKSINDLDATQKQGEAAMTDIATGEVKNLHQAAIAINKAESSMKFMLEVRNKAINAYKEISRTQI